MDLEDDNFSDASSVSSSTSSASSALSSVSDIIENNSSFRYMRYKITTGKRRNSKMIFTTDEEQYYSFNSSNKNCDAYKCVECNSRVHLNKVTNILTQKVRYYVHNHAKKGKLEENLNILNEIKMKCADITLLINGRKQSVRDIFYSVLSKYPAADIEFFKHERTLQLIINAALPKNPVNTSDIVNIFQRDDLMQLLGNAKDNSQFFDGVLEGNDYSACFFSSKPAIELFEINVLPGKRVIMIDGTFDVVPVGSFKQLLIIYAVYMEKVSVISIFYRKQSACS